MKATKRTLCLAAFSIFALISWAFIASFVHHEVAKASSSCYCIDVELCNGCGECIDACPDCLCWNESQTHPVFCVPNDCGNPDGALKLCDVNENSCVAEAADYCWSEALHPCAE